MQSAHAEFTNLQDKYNFELNREGKNGAEFEGGWTAAKYAALQNGSMRILRS